MENRLNIWIRFLLPFFLALFLGIMIFMMAQFREPPEFRWYALFWFVGSVFIIWEAGWFISKKLDQSFPWRVGTFRRLSVQLLVTNLFGIFFFLGTFILLNLYETKGLGSNNSLGLLHILVTLSEAFIIVQIVNSIQISYQLLQNWQTVQLEAEKYKKEKVIAQLERLRQQIDPHFFNASFSELQTLLEEKPNRAAEFIEGLSQDYQNRQASLASNLVNVQEVLKIENGKNIREKKNEENESENYKNRFLVKSGTRFFLIPVREIAVIYKDDIVLLFTKDGKKYPLDYSLEELSAKLDRRIFFRINRQHIINANYLKEMRSEANQLLITLTIGFPNTLAVSQRNVATFKKWLNEE